MYYITFTGDRAVGLTAMTRYGLEEIPGTDCVEPHDDWPEKRNYINLLDYKLDIKNLPENVAWISVSEFMDLIKSPAAKNADE